MTDPHDPDALRRARDDIDRVIARIQRVADHVDDPDNDLGLAVQSLQISRDYLRRWGHDARFDGPEQEDIDGPTT